LFALVRGPYTKIPLKKSSNVFSKDLKYCSFDIWTQATFIGGVGRGKVYYDKIDVNV
jgi:hypothetical protein